MSARIHRIETVAMPQSSPRFELRVKRHGPGDLEMEVWQLPSPATPHLHVSIRVAGLRGRNLELTENRVLKRLGQNGIRLNQKGATKIGYGLPEDLALNLSLLFRALAPMQSRDNIRKVIEGIEAMGHEEASYWLGMALHRKNPRRVLTALRYLLTDPASKRESVWMPG
jgi:hypothetical protein